jgi:bifunctional DNA-binding transcriptional regulator/antitoxin component of YhaV-PrlF toxin-antitoxin module
MKIPKELLQGQDVKPGDEVCFTVASADDMSVELDDASVKVEPASEEASEPADANAPKPEMSQGDEHETRRHAEKPSCDGEIR